MGAYLHVKEMFPNIIERAEKLNYPASSICILKGDIQKLQSQYIETYENLNSCRHNRDARSLIEYGQDLVASWLIEDLIIEELQNQGLNIKGDGSDKKREVLRAQKVSAGSDCLVVVGEKSKKLELMCDYTGYWKRTKKIDLRDSKFNKMKSTNSLFLGISTIDNTYVLIDIPKTSASYIERHFPYGGKPAYSLTVKREDLMELDYLNLKEKILSLI